MTKNKPVDDKSIDIDEIFSNIEEEPAVKNPFWKSTKFKLFAAAGAVAAVVTVAAAFAGKDEDEETSEEIAYDDFPIPDASDPVDVADPVD